MPRYAVHAPAATARPVGGSGPLLALDPLFDRTEHAVAGRVQHLDPDHVAERHERRGRLAVAQGLHGALLGVDVDLLTPGDLPPKFRAKVLAEAQPI